MRLKLFHTSMGVRLPEKKDSVVRNALTLAANSIRVARDEMVSAVERLETAANIMEPFDPAAAGQVAGTQDVVQTLADEISEAMNSLNEFRREEGFIR